MAIKNDDGDHARALRSIHQVATPTKRMKFGISNGMSSYGVVWWGVFGIGCWILGAFGIPSVGAS